MDLTITATPLGTVRKYNYKNNKDTIISRIVPYDKKHPLR